MRSQQTRTHTNVRASGECEKQSFSIQLNYSRWSKTNTTEMPHSHTHTKTTETWQRVYTSKNRTRCRRMAPIKSNNRTNEMRRVINTLATKCTWCTRTSHSLRATPTATSIKSIVIFLSHHSVGIINRRGKKWIVSSKWRSVAMCEHFSPDDGGRFARRTSIWSEMPGHNYNLLRFISHILIEWHLLRISNER